MKSLLVGGSVLLIISLALAWVLTMIRMLNVEAVRRFFPAHENVLKAHIDYVLMSLLLYAFHGLAPEYPLPLVVMMIAGATINPLLFLVVAHSKPDEFRPGRIFSATAFLSFTMTTLGFGGAAVTLLL